MKSELILGNYELNDRNHKYLSKDNECCYLYIQGASLTEKKCKNLRQGGIVSFAFWELLFQEVKYFSKACPILESGLY